jgi:aspartyl aminopeptidase
MKRKPNVRKQRNPDSSKADILQVIVCEIGGLECLLWFDEDGELHGIGSKEARAGLESLLDRYTPLMKKKDVIEAVSGLEPVGQEHLPIKKFAVLALMLEADEQGKRPEDIVLAKELIEDRIKQIRELPDLG